MDSPASSSTTSSRSHGTTRAVAQSISLTPSIETHARRRTTDSAALAHQAWLPPCASVPTPMCRAYARHFHNHSSQPAPGWNQQCARTATPTACCLYRGH
eukprot:6491139-Amphidinium_carterae.2